MPKASVKRLIECEKDDLIKLVLDIEKYPEFVPWCLSSKIYEKLENNDTILFVSSTNTNYNNKIYIYLFYSIQT